MILFLYLQARQCADQTPLPVAPYQYPAIRTLLDAVFLRQLVRTQPRFAGPAIHHRIGEMVEMAARAEVAGIVNAQPDFAEGLSALGMLDAALGNKEDAIREGQRAVELLPPSKDAVVGPMLLQNLSTIHAWTGEKTAAIQELKEVTSMPSYLGYGILLRHPLWSPLRDEPEFKAILTSLAPAAP